MNYPLIGSHIYPIKGSDDQNTLKLIVKRALTMNKGESYTFEFNNCKFMLRCGIHPAEPKYTIGSCSSRARSQVICGKRPSTNDPRRAINKIVIQEIHIL